MKDSVKVIIKKVLVVSTLVAAIAALSACSNFKRVFSGNNYGGSYSKVQGSPIKPVNNALELGATNTAELMLALDKAKKTEGEVKIFLTPGTYMVHNSIILPENTTLTTFNPSTKGKYGPWLISDMHNNNFTGPVLVMNKGSKLKGVNVKQLSNNSTVMIDSLPVTIENSHFQAIKDQSLLFINTKVKAAQGYQSLTLTGVTLTNIYLHKTAPSIRVSYSNPIDIKLINCYVNYPNGPLVNPKTAKVTAENTTFKTDLHGLSVVYLDKSKYRSVNAVDAGIVS